MLERQSAKYRRLHRPILPFFLTHPVFSGMYADFALGSERSPLVSGLVPIFVVVVVVVVGFVADETAAGAPLETTSSTRCIVALTDAFDDDDDDNGAIWGAVFSATSCRIRSSSLPLIVRTDDV